MAIYIWNPITDYVKATPKHISTRGIFPGHLPLTVGTDGFIRPILTDIHITMGGAADVTTEGGGDYIGSGTIYVDGVSAPIVSVINGVSDYDYQPVGAINVDGASAPFVIGLDGNLIYDYPSVGNELGVLGGDTDDTEITMNYGSAGGIGLAGDTDDTEITMNYPAEGGIVLDGEALVYYRKKPGFGGRGVLPVPHRKRTIPVQTPHHFIWYAPLLSRFALNPRGSAECEFVKGKKFAFISDLPKIEKTEEKLTLLKTINDYVKAQPETTVHTFVSSGSAINIGGDCVVVQDNPVQQQIRGEDELVLLLIDGEPQLIITTVDKDINKQRRDDELLMQYLLDM